MCGIVGYAGSRQAAPILLDGLSKLEYRGYDSAGICIHGSRGLSVEKAKGRLSVLSEKTQGGNTVKGTVGIGHTRWATHGAPSDINSHPHLSDSGKIAVVHNGIIENETALRKKLEHLGLTFRSETDTEVISNLIGFYYSKYHDFVKAVRHAMARLEGSLKLKEVAYLHSEAYPAGELKHGPISLIEEGTLVVALATVDALFDKTMANVKEVKARGADVMCVTMEGREQAASLVADNVIALPNVHPVLRSSLSLIPLQLFAYYVSVNRGCDVDKPRNFAKSVTVE